MQLIHDSSPATMRFPCPCDYTYMLHMCTDVHTYSIHRESHAQVHTCTSTPRQAHIPTCTCTWRHSHTHTHIQCTLVHMCTASHIHTCMHRLSLTMLHPSCFASWLLQLSLTLVQWWGLYRVWSSHPLHALRTGWGLSCMSLGVKGEPQALGPGKAAYMYC